MTIITQYDNQEEAGFEARFPKLMAAVASRIAEGMTRAEALADVGRAYAESQHADAAVSMASHSQHDDVPVEDRSDAELSGHGPGMRRLMTSGLAACMKPFTPKGRGHARPADPEARYQAACRGLGNRSLAAVACAITFQQQA